MEELAVAGLLGVDNAVAKLKRRRTRHTLHGQRETRTILANKLVRYLEGCRSLIAGGA